MKTYFYVDAFNLYYGAVKGSAYRWLNPYELFTKIFPQAQIVRIKYFTARVKPHPSNPDQLLRQQLLLRALATIPGLDIIEGHYLSHKVWMPLANPTIPNTIDCVKVIKTEEKGSDVNLASHLLFDGFNSAFEQAIVVSGDSDLATPIEMIKSHLNKPVGVLLPQLLNANTTRRRSSKLQAVASFYRAGIREGVLKVSQFPDTMTDQHGQFRKPAAW